RGGGRKRQCDPCGKLNREAGSPGEKTHKQFWPLELPRYLTAKPGRWPIFCFTKRKLKRPNRASLNHSRERCLLGGCARHCRTHAQVRGAPPEGQSEGFGKNLHITI